VTAAKTESPIQELCAGMLARNLVAPAHVVNIRRPVALGQPPAR
jgi:hypothetical protein